MKIERKEKVVNDWTCSIRRGGSWIIRNEVIKVISLQIHRIFFVSVIKKCVFVLFFWIKIRISWLKMRAIGNRKVVSSTYTYLFVIICLEMAKFQEVSFSKTEQNVAIFVDFGARMFSRKKKKKKSLTRILQVKKIECQYTSIWWDFNWSEFCKSCPFMKKPHNTKLHQLKYTN